VFTPFDQGARSCERLGPLGDVCFVSRTMGRCESCSVWKDFLGPPAVKVNGSLVVGVRLGKPAKSMYTGCICKFRGKGGKVGRTYAGRLAAVRWNIHATVASSIGRALHFPPCGWGASLPTDVADQTAASRR